MIYGQKWRDAKVRRNFGVLTLSFQMARRTTNAIQRRRFNAHSARSGSRNLALYISTFTHRLNFGSGLIRAAPPLLRARSLLLNLYLKLLTFCSVELSPVSGPCCLLDSHALSMFGVFHEFCQLYATVFKTSQNRAPLTEIAHLGSTWFFINGTVGLTMDLPCNMAVYARSLSIFLLSQFMGLT